MSWSRTCLKHPTSNNLFFLKKAYLSKLTYFQSNALNVAAGEWTDLHHEWVKKWCHAARKAQRLHITCMISFEFQLPRWSKGSSLLPVICKQILQVGLEDRWFSEGYSSACDPFLTLLELRWKETVQFIIPTLKPANSSASARFHLRRKPLKEIHSPPTFNFYLDEERSTSAAI